MVVPEGWISRAFFALAEAHGVVIRGLLPDDEQLDELFLRVLQEKTIERVGSGDPPWADRTVELPGTTIMPGFVDAHVHLTGTGLDIAGPDLSSVRSKEDLLALLADSAGEANGALLVHGFDESAWDRPGLPTMEELDRVSSEALIAVRADGHVSMANTAALSSSNALTEEGVERDRDGSRTAACRSASQRPARRRSSRAWRRVSDWRAPASCWD